MPKTRQQKEAELKEFQEKIARLGAGALFFVNYRGLDVVKSRVLRREIKRTGGEFAVLKKTLARLAFQKFAIPHDPTALEGEAGFVFGYQDPLATAKAIYQFFRREAAPVLLGGWFEGRVLDAAEVTALATLPPREILLTWLVGALAGPVRGLVVALNEINASFVRVLAARVKVYIG